MRSAAETKVSLLDEIGQEIGRYVSEDVSVFDTEIVRAWIGSLASYRRRHHSRDQDRASPSESQRIR